MRKWGVLSILLLLAGPLAASPLVGEPQPLVMPAATRLMVLGEMRQLLNAVGQVLEGVAGNKLAGLDQVARAAGVGLGGEHAQQVHPYLPPEFRQLGMVMHQQWYTIADALAMEDKEAVVRELATLIRHCNNCHANFRLEAAR